MPARFDPALIQRGARLKRSPFFEATQRAGCLGYTIYNHMLLPIRYDIRKAAGWSSCRSVRAPPRMA